MTNYNKFLVLHRHLIFAPSMFDSYAAMGLPGINDLLHEFDDLSNDDKKKRTNELRKHISDITISIHKGINMLKSFDGFS